MTEITLTPEQMAELKAVIRDEVKAEIRAAASPFRDRAGAGAFLGISPKTVDEYKREGRLVPKYVGDKPIYKVADLLKFPTKRPTPDCQPAA